LYSHLAPCHLHTHFMTRQVILPPSHNLFHLRQLRGTLRVRHVHLTLYPFLPCLHLVYHSRNTHRVPHLVHHVHPPRTNRLVIFNTHLVHHPHPLSTNRLIIFNTSPTSSRPCCIPSTHHSHFRSPYTHMSCILRVMHGTRVGPRTVISLHIRAMHGTRVGPRTIITLSMRTDWCV